MIWAIEKMNKKRRKERYGCLAVKGSGAVPGVKREKMLLFVVV